MANQLRKLYMGSLEDEEEKAQMMTPEELMKVSNTINKNNCFCKTKILDQL